MPVYNAAKTLSPSIESVLQQSHVDWELLLIDDGSTDGSRRLIEESAARDPRIQPVYLETNAGAAEARNVGVRKAKGRFIAFLDSDDLWLPTKLEKQVAKHLEQDLAITFTDYEWIDSTGHSMKIVVRAPDHPTWRDLTWGNNIGLSTSMVDRGRAGDPIMLPLRLNHDFALWLELLRKGNRAERLPEVLVLYRMHAGSLSQNKAESTLTNWKILHRIEGLSVFETFPRMLFWSVRTAARRLLAHHPA
jgi:teichuronic acid biosynthesis glycosyltransferase TuaG